MAVIKTDSQHYTDIADAIRELIGSTKQYKPEEMEPAISEYAPDYLVSYDTFDTSGHVKTATIYGNTIAGLGGCINLESVNIPNTVKRVAPHAFDNVGFFMDEITLPESVEIINEYGFSAALFKTINLPPNIKELPASSFLACINLTSITLPSNLTKISQGAFNLCSALKEITIPASVDVIEDLAFFACGFETVTFLGKPSRIGTSGIFMLAPFYFCSDITTVNVPWSLGEVAGAPWGAVNATINYNYVAE